MSTSRYLARLAWIPLVVWLVSVVAAEYCYRLLGVHVVENMEGFYEPFGQRSYRHRPRANVFMNWFSGSFSVHTDLLGFRVAALSDTAQDIHNPEVLVIGDSQAFGQGVEFEDTVIGAFAREARTLGITVANAAVAGHFLRNQVELVRCLVAERALRPRLIIVCLTPRALAAPAAYAHAFVRDGALFDQPPGLLQLGRKWLSTHSAAYVVVRNAVRARGSDNSMADLLGLYQDAQREERIRGLSDVLADLMQVLDPIQGRVVLAYLPLAAEFRVDELARKRPRSQSGAAAREPYGVADAVSRAYRIPLIDLTPPLRLALEGGERLTLRGDQHYNQAVSRSCAKHLLAATDWRALTSRK
jgi:hypothetical protein